MQLSVRHFCSICQRLEIEGRPQIMVSLNLATILDSLITSHFVHALQFWEE